MYYACVHIPQLGIMSKDEILLCNFYRNKKKRNKKPKHVESSNFASVLEPEFHWVLNRLVVWYCRVGKVKPDTILVNDDGAYVMNQRNIVMLNEVTEDCNYFMCFVCCCYFGVAFLSAMQMVNKMVVYGVRRFVVWNV